MPQSEEFQQFCEIMSMSLTENGRDTAMLKLQHFFRKEKKA